MRLIRNEHSLQSVAVRDTAGLQRTQRQRVPYSRQEHGRPPHAFAENAAPSFANVRSDEGRRRPDMDQQQGSRGGRLAEALADVPDGCRLVLGVCAAVFAVTTLTGDVPVICPGSVVFDPWTCRLSVRARALIPAF